MAVLRSAKRVVALPCAAHAPSRAASVRIAQRRAVRGPLMRIALTGFARAGKSTCARALRRIGYREFAFADELKRMCSRLFGIDATRKLDAFEGRTVRDLLRAVGTELFRVRFAELFPAFAGRSVWVEHIERKIARTPGPIVVSDVRFPDEAASMRRLGFTIVDIRRPGVVAGAHASEHGVRGDLRVNNTSTTRALAERIRAVAHGL